MKINKEDLPLMYSCVFRCEFIDSSLLGEGGGAVGGCYCVTPVTDPSLDEGFLTVFNKPTWRGELAAVGLWFRTRRRFKIS